MHMTVREKLRSWADRTSLHGVPHLAASQRTTMKVIWLVVLLIATGYCGRLASLTIIEYFEFDVKTVVEILREGHATFPTVTFCYLLHCGLEETYNTTEYVTRYWEQEGSRLAGGKSKEEFLRTLDKAEVLRWARTTYLQNNSKEVRKHMEELRRESIRLWMISCQYNIEICSEKDFEVVMMDEFTKCWRFNGLKEFFGKRVEPREARRYGKNFGLQAELYVGRPDQCISPLGTTAGAIVYVHNNTQAITRESNGIYIVPGTETNIAIDRTFVRQMPDPYTSCVPNKSPELYRNEMVSATFRTHSQYTQTACLQMCAQTYTMRRYGCYNVYLPRDNETEVRMGVHNECLGVLDMANNSEIFERTKFYAEREDKKCFAECPAECEVFTYDYTVSMAQFPSQTYSEVFFYNGNVTARFKDARTDTQFGIIQSGTLALNVYYRNDMYTHIRDKEAIQFDAFVSNFGGALGLLLGISLLSFVELFEVAYECLAIFVENRLRGRKKNKNIMLVGSLTASQTAAGKY